jgi:hypothetical protein
MSNRKVSRAASPRNQRPQGEGPEYRNWLTLVPPEQRENIAALIKKHPVKDYDDLVSFSQVLMAELMQGNITPAIAREARLWTELMFTVLATKNTALGTPEAAYSDVITALVAVRRESPRIEASYTMVDAEPLPEKIVVNNE